MTPRSIILHTDSKVISFKSVTGDGSAPKTITIPTVTVNEVVFQNDAMNGKDGAPGPQGPQGIDGKSAYQIAVEHGFEGTEQEWLDSLHGADHSIDTESLQGVVVIKKGNDSYAIVAEKIVAPTAPTLPANNTFDGSQTISVTNVPSGASVRYTTDGTDPTATSGNTGTSISLAQDSEADTKAKTYTIKAISVKNGLASDIVERTYTINRKLAAPSITDPSGDKYDVSRNVTITNNAVDGVRGTLTYKIGANGEIVTPTLDANYKVTISANDKVYAYVANGDTWVGNSAEKAVATNARKCYIGQAASLADNAAIKALANSYKKDTLVGSTVAEINFGSTTEYVWFCIPNTAARNLSVKSKGFDVTLQSESGSIVGNYRVWRTVNRINDKFTFAFS